MGVTDGLGGGWVCTKEGKIICISDDTPERAQYFSERFADIAANCAPGGIPRKGTNITDIKPGDRETSEAFSACADEAAVVAEMLREQQTQGQIPQHTRPSLTLINSAQPETETTTEAFSRIHNKVLSETNQQIADLQANSSRTVTEENLLVTLKELRKSIEEIEGLPLTDGPNQ